MFYRFSKEKLRHGALRMTQLWDLFWLKTIRMFNYEQFTDKVLFEVLRRIIFLSKDINVTSMGTVRLKSEQKLTV